MKKIVLALMLLVGFTSMAQKGERGNRGTMKDLTPEQIATLQTKKATLALDLTESQQAQMKALLTENAKQRKAKMAARKAQKENGELKKPTSEERYAKANKALDHKIAQKAELKKILSDEQLAKWEKMQHRSRKHRRGKGQREKAHKSKKERE